MGVRYAEIIEAENFLGDRAIILSEAGRQEEALPQLTENFLLFPDDPWVIIKGGGRAWELGQPEQAERLYRQALAGISHSLCTVRIWTKVRNHEPA